MDEPLRSSKRKLRRARVHLNALSRSIARRSRDPDVILSYEGEMETTGAQAYSLGVTMETRDSWGLIVGDIVSNLRASLDHIAWEFYVRRVVADGKRATLEEERAIQFPLFASRPLYDDPDKGISKLLRLLPDGVGPTFEWFQPYNSMLRPELRHLIELQDLSNMDKHRVVTDVRPSVSVWFTPERAGHAMVFDQPYAMTVIFTKKVIDRLGDDFKPHTTSKVVIKRTSVSDAIDIDELTNTHDFIRDKVVPAFSRLIP